MDYELFWTILFGGYTAWALMAWVPYSMYEGAFEDKALAASAFMTSSALYGSVIVFVALVEGLAE